LERRASEGLRIFPIVIKPCDWGAVDWLRRMNLRPKDGKPLSGGNEHEIDQAFTEIAKEIRELLKWTAPPATPTFVPLNPDEISTSRLPGLLTPHLFGRDDELQLLDKAWADPHTNIVNFVAWGGVGKSALVSHWLMRVEQENYRGAERVYAWSFYSQGTSDQTATAEYFIHDALRWFGGDALADQLATASPWEKGERLARLVRQTRTLLILDGLEPVQYPPGLQEGRLKEQSLQALLRTLADQQWGLCVISTREAVGDLTQYEGGAVVRHDLTNLSPQAGAQLLRELKVKGTEADLEAAAREYGGHSLALTLLGSYLGDVYAGDVRRRHEIENLEDDVRHGWQVTKMMRAYEKWLGKRQELAMLDVLRLLGLFDRPAEAASVAALRAAPPIPGLTNSLFRYEHQKRWFGLFTTDKAKPVSENEWQKTVSALRRIWLLAEAVEQAPDQLDAHPLVREHFRAQLKAERPDAWRAGNLRLYEHLTRTAKEFPDRIKEMEPLFAAVTHGCEAGRHQEALEKVYARRIMRYGEYFSWSKLGAFDADLAALKGFFAVPWQQPVPDLPEAHKALILSHASLSLRALGRLKEAIRSIQAGTEIYISQENWRGASNATAGLSELYLTVGEVSQALIFAQHSVELADRSGDSFLRIARRTTLADAMHRAGRLNEAEEAFRKAEAMQTELEPDYPLLYSQGGFRYCDLLLGRGKYQEVQNRGERLLELRVPSDSLLDIALENLSLGRAFLLQARREDDGATVKAADFLKRAVDGLQQAGVNEFLSRGLLAHAELHRVTSDYLRAQSDLDKAFALATRGEMRLHLADCHLESARLSLATGDRVTARKSWETAKAMIEEMGYHRRDGEVAELAQALGASME
ncbi:MAG: tetratricopeptide repeat protein, partial [Blastocatellia bacterium]